MLWQAAADAIIIWRSCDAVASLVLRGGAGSTGLGTASGNTDHPNSQTLVLRLKHGLIHLFPLCGVVGWHGATTGVQTIIGWAW